MLGSVCTSSGGSTGGPEGATAPPEIFLAPSLAPPLFKEDIMSFLDFLILYRRKSLVSASGPLVAAKGFQLWEVLKLSIIIIIIIINEIFIHFSVTYIAFNTYPVKINDYKLINKIKMAS